MTGRIIYRFPALAGIWLFMNAMPAHAYIDPGTGALVVQMLLAALAGTLFYFKWFVHKVKGFFGLNKQDPEKTLNKDKRAELDTNSKSNAES